MKYIICFSVLFSLFACGDQKFEEVHLDPVFAHKSMKTITDVMVHDIFSPPVASRIYAYSSIAAYQTMAALDSNFISLAGQIDHLTECPTLPKGNVYIDIAANEAMLQVGKNLLFSEDRVNRQIHSFYTALKALKLNQDALQNSLSFGDSVANHIIAWAKKDMYAQTRTFPKYSVTEEAGRWRPTPPGYMDGIEPAWNKIRPMCMNSADQFKPIPPTPYSIDKSSLFYREAMEVYETQKSNDKEKEEIARFWDCNPFALNVKGHVMMAVKKISPGGHWINIAALACNKAKSDFRSSVSTYAIVSIGLFDAFISCWDEKYRTNLIRPESYIQDNIDKDWIPTLQTPPFPEYTSGHSVASRSAAVILTHIFGENFAFDDVTEEEFGLPMRSFTSFKHASEEAAVSRMYGGIHYMPAITNGITQGANVGNNVLTKIKMKQN